MKGVQKERKVLIDQGFQKCTKCGEIKPLPEYHKDKSTAYGYGYRCKACKKQKDVERHKKQWADPNVKAVLKERMAKQFQKHKYKRNKTHCARKKQRKLTDPNYAMREKLCSALREIIRKDFKNSYMEKYIGVSISEFKIYMGIYAADLRNYEIDHIIPQSLYDLTDEKEIYKCYNFKNLRLISKIKNKNKRNTLDFSLIKEYDIFNLLPKGVNYE